MSTTMKGLRAVLVALGTAAPLVAQVRTVTSPRAPADAPARAVAGDEAPMMFAARGHRTSNAVIARDIAWFDSLEAAANTRAASVRNAAPSAARSAALIALAREAYLRNDDGALTAALLVRAGVLAGSDVTPPAASRELWLFATEQQRTAGRDSARLARTVALEVALLRAATPLLGAPDCRVWEARAQQIASELRLAPRPEAPVAVQAAPAPAPVVAPPVAPAAAPPAPLAAPRELRGVPSRVHFGLDRSDLSPASRRALDALVDSLFEFPGVRIVLSGHTDMRASAAYNAALSQRRAMSVQRYMISRGIDAGRMSYVAKGKSQLEQAGTGITEHAKNRRVEMQFIAPDGSEIPSLQQMDDLQLERPAPVRAAPRRRVAPPARR